MKKSLSYDDLGLVPRQPSSVNSRDELSTEIEMFGVDFALPLIVAPMRSIITPKNIKKYAQERILSFIPRGWEEKDRLNIAQDISQNDARLVKYIGVAIGLNTDFHKIEYYINRGYRIFCLDVANGFNTKVQKFCLDFTHNFSPFYLIAGNVNSREGFNFLTEGMADGIRVGIGNGGACSTSLATGVGQGQASALQEIVTSHYSYGSNIIADGNIKKPADMVKALCLGADAVMAGYIFSQTLENPTFYGEASKFAKNGTRYIEGANLELKWDKLKPLNQLVQEYKDGLKSAMSYLAVDDIEDLKTQQTYDIVELSNNAQIERGIIK